jgi:hypothetical protein
MTSSNMIDEYKDALVVQFIKDKNIAHINVLSANSVFAGSRLFNSPVDNS